MGVIIAIVNNKGGVGKTVISCNLGEALARLNRRVLIVDADGQANATNLLTPHGAVLVDVTTLANILDPDQWDGHTEIIPMVAQDAGVHLLPNGDTAYLEPKILNNIANGSLYRLRDRLRDWAKENYDYTLIDCPPNIGAFVMSVLLASDCVVVPVDAGSTHSIMGLEKAIDLVFQVRDTANPELRFLRLLINKADRRTRVTRMNEEDIERKFGSTDDPAKSLVFETRIPVNTSIQAAERMRKTVLQHDPGCTSARAFRRLAKEVTTLLEEPANATNAFQESSAYGG